MPEKFPKKSTKQSDEFCTLRYLDFFPEYSRVNANTFSVICTCRKQYDLDLVFRRVTKTVVLWEA